MTLLHEHEKLLINMIVDKAVAAAGGRNPEMYLRNLVQDAVLPPEWRMEANALIRGFDIKSDARDLIRWAIHLPINRADNRYTTLGSLINPMLSNLDEDQERYIIALVHINSLYRQKRLQNEFGMAYQIPMDALEIGGDPVDFGPEIVWQGPNDNDIELQGFFGKPPELFDVDFLKNALKQSRYVCRIESPEGTFKGTGFLVEQLDWLLTNYHVLKYDENDDLNSNIENTILRFGCFKESNGDVEKGQIFKLDSKTPLIESSPTNELDFLLLKLDDSISKATGIIEAGKMDLSLPPKKAGLHILQHPEGETMKLAITGDAVTGVYEDKGLMQYVTRARSGSSGSPCFNDEWKVVALHHAQRAKVWGSVREGILMHKIHERILKHL